MFSFTQKYWILQWTIQFSDYGIIYKLHHVWTRLVCELNSPVPRRTRPLHSLWLNPQPNKKGIFDWKELSGSGLDMLQTRGLSGTGAELEEDIGKKKKQPFYAPSKIHPLHVLSRSFTKQRQFALGFKSFLTLHDFWRSAHKRVWVHLAVWWGF